MVIVCEFCCWQQICPIVLLVQTEHPQVGFHPFVVIFDLSLSLWVIHCGEMQLDSKVLIDTFCKICSKCQTTISAVYEGDPVQFPDMMNVWLHQVWSQNISHCQNEMQHFRESIGDDVDGVETIGFRQFTNKVRLDPLPWAIGSRNWLKFSVLTLIPVFHLSAGVTALYVSLYPVRQILTPITPRHKLQCAQSA
jgi:hypothetical protein